MLARIMSSGFMGIDGFPVYVETDVSRGLPGTEIVGLPDASVKESRERVRTAIKNSGFEYPISRITINLAPADVKKEGPVYDLPIAIGIMSCSGLISRKSTEGVLFIGELSLNGDVKPVTGVLPMLIDARSRGIKKAVIPPENVNEAVYIDGIDCYAFQNIADIKNWLNDTIQAEPIKIKPFEAGCVSNDVDFSLIKGQDEAKRAMQIAAAGGHNILLIGSPGSGKTMLARSLPGILPDMTFEEALETTKIHSALGELKHGGGLVTVRPFRSPHHTASSAAIIGGGRNANPGEVSLAHNGVLFLDELPEFNRDVLESLRQPLEDGFVSITRVNAKMRYPASFILVASMNPCPCGNYGSADLECKCTPRERSRYLAKISGPLLDRIDLHISVDRPKYSELTDKRSLETSAQIKEKLNRARQIQIERYKNDGIFCNAELKGDLIAKYCKIDSVSEKLLENAFTRLKLSARSYTRLLLISRTIADMAEMENIQPQHIAEAIQYRVLDRKYEGVY